MLLVKLMAFVGLLMTTGAMTNHLVMLLTAVVVLLVRGVSVFGMFSVGLGFGIYQGLLAGFLFGALVWGNLPFEDDHGHEHGAAPSHGDFWDPWGIAFRLVTSVMVCLGATLFSCAVSEVGTHVLGVDRSELMTTVVLVFRGGAVLLALLAAAQVALNWSSALPQGPGSMPAPQQPAPAPAPTTPGGDHAAH